MVIFGCSESESPVLPLGAKDQHLLSLMGPVNVELFQSTSPQFHSGLLCDN